MHFRTLKLPQNNPIPHVGLTDKKTSLHFVPVVQRIVGKNLKPAVDFGFVLCKQMRTKKKEVYSTTNGMSDMPPAAIFPGCRFRGDRVDTHHARQSDQPYDRCGSGLLRHQPEQTVWSPTIQVFPHLSGSTAAALSSLVCFAGVIATDPSSRAEAAPENDDALPCTVIVTTTVVWSEMTPPHLRYTICAAFFPHKADERDTPNRCWHGDRRPGFNIPLVRVRHSGCSVRSCLALLSAVHLSG